ncbi:Anamorsin [Geodia barretti]|uniref:Anamorsin n=1 Tax=Geodia barretti TaxID=519541 RepID=A0AA35WT56_GEOBA|nr:Anamorsin [Geodia barretti]
MELVPDSALLNRTVMVVWHGGTTPEVLQPLVKRLRERVGEKGRVMLENADRLESIPHEESSVEVVLTGFLPPPSLTHSPPLLGELARLLKPSGLLFLREPITTTTTASGSVEGVRSVKKLTSALKLSGFVDVSEVEASEYSGLLAGLQANGVTAGQDTISVAFVSAKKPSYEVGASSTLSFANRLPQPTNKVSSETANVWSLDPADDNLDMLDSDTLLEEEDLVKPDPDSLRSIYVLLQFP